MSRFTVAFAALLLAGCVSTEGLGGGGGGGDGDGGPGVVTEGPPSATGGSDADVATVAVRHATVSVTASGTGTGAVGSKDLGIDCGGQCSRAYPIGSLVELTGSAFAGSVFTGWQGPCGGTGVCAILVSDDVTVSALFAARVLDIDGNAIYGAPTDGKLVTRYLFGLTGTSLSDGAVGANATRSQPADLLAYLTSIRPKLDVDGNGTPDALTDGLMVERYMQGSRGAQLTTSAMGTGATRDTAQIEAYLKELTPQ